MSDIDIERLRRAADEWDASEQETDWQPLADAARFLVSLADQGGEHECATDNPAAQAVLAALRADGWELYRPAFEGIEIWYCDDCALGAEFRSDLACPHADALPTYRLVPVESEDRQ